MNSQTDYPSGNETVPFWEKKMAGVGLLLGAAGGGAAAFLIFSVAGVIIDAPRLAFVVLVASGVWGVIGAVLGSIFMLWFSRAQAKEMFGI